MIDRTTLDLRLAAHHTTTARIDARDWQRQGPRPPSAARVGLAAALAALAARLDPAAVRPGGTPRSLPSPLA